MPKGLHWSNRFRPLWTIRSCVAALIATMVLMAGTMLAWMYMHNMKIEKLHTHSNYFHAGTIYHLDRITNQIRAFQVWLLSEQRDAPHSSGDRSALSVSGTATKRDHLQYELVKNAEKITELHRQYRGEQFHGTLVRLTDQIHQLVGATLSTDHVEQTERQFKDLLISTDQLRRLHTSALKELQQNFVSTTQNHLLGFGGFVALTFIFGGILSFHLTRHINETTKRLEDSNERYNKAEHIGEFGHYEYSLTNSHFEPSLEFNRIFGLTLGNDMLTLEQVIELIHADDRDTVMDMVESVTTQKKARSVECRVNRPDQTQSLISLNCEPQLNHQGHTETLVGVVKDITISKRVEQKLWDMAHRDMLTGLANRTQMMAILDQAIRREEGDQDYKYALFFLDFDRFKIINDSLGHDAGDNLLKSIAQRLSHTLGEIARDRFATSGHIARLGGDEFVILIDGFSQYRDIASVAERLQTNLSLPHRVKEHELVSTASIGVVTNESRHSRPEAVIQAADLAMYEAKALGRARCVVFDTRMREEAVKRLNVETDLRSALNENQLRLVYQPIVCLESGQVEGFEALLRWQHPIQGLIMPNDFIEIAEETGLIERFGQWVIHQACRQLNLWHQRYPSNNNLFMSINVSKKQLVHSNFANRTMKLIQESGVQPQHIKLEVTESTIMGNVSSITEALQRLHDQGIAISMDDFGTGLSSLSYLDSFPIDVLKIDRGFIEPLDSKRGYAAIVHAIITLAHNLNMQVVAEGVESMAHVAQLQALECDLAQGYYFSKPVEAAVCESMICQRQPFHQLA